MVSDIVSAAAATDAVTAAGRCATTSVVSLDDFKTADLGLLRQEHLAEEITCDYQRLLLLWRAPRALIVGRSDTRLPNFSNAVDRLDPSERRERLPCFERNASDRACPDCRPGNHDRRRLYRIDEHDPHCSG